MDVFDASRVNSTASNGPSGPFNEAMIELHRGGDVTSALDVAATLVRIGQESGAMWTERNGVGLQGLAALARQLRIAIDDETRVIARGCQDIGIPLQAGEAEIGHTRLPRAEDLAFAAEFQVGFGDLEAVLRAAQRFEARSRDFAERSTLRP